MNRINKSEVKKRLTRNGAPLFGILVFAAAFFITVFVVGQLGKADVDRQELGKSVREIVDGEDGEVVAVINGVEYHEKDLKLVIESFRLSQPQYLKLNDEQIRAVAGDSLIEQKMLVQEFDRLGLVLTDEEIDEYIDNEKKTASEKISSGSQDGIDFLDYVVGYGCTFNEYWENEYVREEMIISIKTDRVQTKICEMKGLSKQTLVAIQKYLSGLLEDGTYEVTLFGEKFPKETN